MALNMKKTKTMKFVFVALRSKTKDWLGWNQDNVFEWSYMSIRGLLLQ